MNKYLILGRNFKNPNSAYRGIDRRDVPDTPDDTKKAELLNQSIEKYFKEKDLSTYEGEYLTDYHFATEIANSFTSNNNNGEVFEVVQIVYPNEPEPIQLTFLGYDVIGVNEHGSIIVDQLLINSAKNEEYNKITQQLNKNFLFDRLHLAEEFVNIVVRKIEGKILLRIIGLFA